MVHMLFTLKITFSPNYYCIGSVSILVPGQQK